MQPRTHDMRRHHQQKMRSWRSLNSPDRRKGFAPYLRLSLHRGCKILHRSCTAPKLVTLGDLTQACTHRKKIQCVVRQTGLLACSNGSRFGALCVATPKQKQHPAEDQHRKPRPQQAAPTTKASKTTTPPTHPACAHPSKLYHAGTVHNLQL